MTLFVAGVLIALGVSALCSVMEATLLSLTPAQVAAMSQRRPSLGRIWQGFKSDVERPIAVILLINTTAHTVGASVAGAQFGKVFGEEHHSRSNLDRDGIFARVVAARLNMDLGAVAFIGQPCACWVARECCGNDHPDEHQREQVRAQRGVTCWSPARASRAGYGDELRTQNLFLRGLEVDGILAARGRTPVEAGGAASNGRS